MSALLHEETLEEYLSGGIRGFAPTTVELVVSAVVNPLKKNPAAIQEQLFLGERIAD